VVGFLPSLVSWPDARRWPQPVVLAAHGAGDYAESHCELWRHLLGRHGIVLCLRGQAIRKGSEDHGYYFPDHLALGRETLAALDSLTRRHPDLVDPKQAVYAGYSQGAQMGMLMLLGRGSLVPRLLLVEGGSGDWNKAYARRFAKSGGERVALVCGTPGCFQNAERSAAELKAAGVWSVVHYARGAGHTYGGPVIAETALAFDQLTRGDERWAD
jgi:predicted esterase